MNISRKTEANPWIARIDWKNMKIFRKRSTCPSIPVSCPNCANTCSRRPSSLVGKGGHAGQGGRRYRNGTRRKGAPGAEYEQPLLIGHSVGVRALGDGTVGQRGGGVISVHDATRRAKMKADAGAAAVIQGPNSVQRTGAILSISPPEREAYLFAFDVRGVNEVGPTLDPLPRELMFVLLRAKLESRDRLRRDGEKSRFVNFKFDCFFKRIEFHDFTFKCIDKDWKERTSKGVKNCISDICREIWNANFRGFHPRIKMLKLNTLHGERNGKKRGKKERKEGAVCVRSEGRKGMGGKNWISPLHRARAQVTSAGDVWHKWKTFADLSWLSCPVIKFSGRLITHVRWDTGNSTLEMGQRYVCNAKRSCLFLSWMAQRGTI